MGSKLGMYFAIRIYCSVSRNVLLFLPLKFCLAHESKDSSIQFAKPFLFCSRGEGLSPHSAAQNSLRSNMGTQPRSERAPRLPDDLRTFISQKISYYILILGNSILCKRKLLPFLIISFVSDTLYPSLTFPHKSSPLIYTPKKTFAHLYTLLFTLYITLFTFPIHAATATQTKSCWTLAQLKYGGGGDYYANPTGLPNFVARLRKELGASICAKPPTIEILSPELSHYPILYITGHGTMKFSESERAVLRAHLLAGGLLFVDDNYGIDSSFRIEMAQLFPHLPLEKVLHNHPLFTGPYAFPKGPPKVHLHDGKPATFWQIALNNRTLVLYTSEMDLGDGWEDPEVHEDPPQIREEALRMGINIVNWYLLGAPASQVQKISR